MEKRTVLYIWLIFSYSASFGQGAQHAKIDLQRASVIIDSLDRKFAKYYFDGDSLGLYAMYTKDAALGASNGIEILATLGSMIRNSIENNTRNIEFTTTSLTSDSEFLIEVGLAQIKDDKHNLKGKFKYLVVWKQENGDWKLYRDIGL
jgi:ketosteroid isomerase-like protein